MTRDCSTVVEHLPQHPKDEGSSPGSTNCTWREKMQKKSSLLVKIIEKLHLNNNHHNDIQYNNNQHKDAQYNDTAIRHPA